MLINRNEKGVTLVEVIAGVILISIILIAIFQFFTNAATFNAKNDKSIQSSTIVREYTVNVSDLYHSLTLEQLTNLHGFVRANDPQTGEIYFKKIESKDRFYIETVIFENRLPQSTYRSLRTAKVSVWDTIIEGPPISQSYTYHEGEVLK